MFWLSIDIIVAVSIGSGLFVAVSEIMFCMFDFCCVIWLFIGNNFGCVGMILLVLNHYLVLYVYQVGHIPKCRRDDVIKDKRQTQYITQQRDTIYLHAVPGG